MRISCNGCRVLRKGCGENCTIKPCLQWITSSESQANATLFLAKFYGRAGLLNLINAGPPNLRPAIFKSLLYEACGRIVNPVYGSLGLFCSGNWVQSQAAVDSVLAGSHIVNGVPVPVLDHGLEMASQGNPILVGSGIRHVFKDCNSGDIHNVQTRTRFKKPGNVIKPKARVGPVLNFNPNDNFGKTRDSLENESAFSVETVEGSLVNWDKPDPVEKDESNEVELELSLGLSIGSNTHLCKGKIG
ncbi:LOB domain-containing protein [Quillaja saponaria]|uniref:LOB domain-containing protein n=1 Tax=Quillaja saponaria TaxID=32244 RepID=A0AAD7KNM1_QUISA|nr:LOB domain-containing protein [Quillaja saponaria]